MSSPADLCVSARRRYEGKIALVTGAAAGLGRASACGFAREGAHVIAVDIDAAAGEETCARIGATGGSAHYYAADVSRPDEVAELLGFIANTFGRLDVAHNNAGILGRSADVVNCESADWDRVIAVNLSSVWHCLKHEIPLMQANGGGSIVNTSSIGGQYAARNSAAYMAAKHGVIGLTRSAALDFGKSGIRVNALLPGAINTAMLAPAAAGAAMPLRAMTEHIPLGRISEPDEQADAVLWLCSSEASFVTGIALLVDGGVTIQV